MQYTTEITIDLPRERVIELFDNPENLPKWQPGLVSFEPLSGTTGQPGARSKLIYDMGKRRIEMIETITRRDLPDAFDGTYETKGVYNEIQNRFTDLGNGQTKWVSHTTFRFTGLMKLMGWFMAGAFKRQSYKFMEQFKSFAEGEK